MNSDEIYLNLKGIRVRACRLQVLVEWPSHRQDLQTVADIVDRIGVWYAPAQWSKYDELPTPGVSEETP